MPKCWVPFLTLGAFCLRAMWKIAASGSRLPQQPGMATIFVSGRLQSPGVEKVNSSGSSPSTLHGSGLPPPNKVETWKDLSVDLQGRMEVLVSGVIQRAGFPEPWASFLSSLSQLFCPQGQEPAARIRAGFASFSFHICRAGNSGTTLWGSHEG